MNLTYPFQILFLFLTCLSFIGEHVLQRLARASWTTESTQAARSNSACLSAADPSGTCGAQFASYRSGYVTPG